MFEKIIKQTFKRTKKCIKILAKEKGGKKIKKIL